MSDFVRVVEDESCPEMAMELPTEPDSTLLMSTIQAQFPAATGLRYKNPDTQGWRGVRMVESALHPPAEEGWADHLFVIVQNKPQTGAAAVDTASKRKIEASPTGKEPETKITKVAAESLGDLVVLGLPWRATEADMKQYFEENIGEVEMVEVKKEPNGKSRGFGFVRFKNADASKAALAQAHKIGGRICEVRNPRTKDELMPKKLFVGRLGPNATKQDIQEYFEQFGEVTDTYIPQPYRNFAFVSFAAAEVAKVVQSRNHVFQGCNLNVTFAEPKHGAKMGMPPTRSWGGVGFDMYPMDAWASRQVMQQQQQNQPGPQHSPHGQQTAFNAYNNMMGMFGGGMMGNKVWGMRK